MTSRVASLEVGLTDFVFLKKNTIALEICEIFHLPYTIYVILCF